MFKRNTKRIAISIFIVRLSRANNYNFELESFEDDDVYLYKNVLCKIL